MKHNIAYKSAPYQATVWTPDKGIHVVRKSPKIKDGEYANEDGVVRFRVVNGVFRKAT